MGQGTNESAMLGEKVGEFSGRPTGIRVLDEGGSMVLEVSIDLQGTMLGVECRNLGTLRAVPRADGTSRVTGQGVLLGQGGEAAQWRALGVRRPPGPDGISRSRGGVTFETTSEAWTRLVPVLGVYEVAADASGEIEETVWEWT